MSKYKNPPRKIKVGAANDSKSYSLQQVKAILADYLDIYYGTIDQVQLDKYIERLREE